MKMKIYPRTIIGLSSASVGAVKENFIQTKQSRELLFSPAFTAAQIMPEFGQKSNRQKLKSLSKILNFQNFNFSSKLPFKRWKIFLMRL